MIGHSVPLPQQTGPVITSWLVSCLLHIALASTTIFLLRQLQLAPQTDSFQWDVAMVAPLPSLANSTPAAQQMIPPAPASPSSTSPTRVMRQPLRPVESATVVESSAESYQEHVIHDESQLSTWSPSPLTDSTPNIVPQEPSDTVREPSDALRDQLTASVESQTPTNPTSAPVLSSNHLRSANADYGWLAAVMARWIEDLDKRYPAMLRSEGMQGKVTLAAILHEDGLLRDVRIVKSSGHIALDQVAVEDVQNGPPIGLFRPLGRAQMPVKFSINYDLTTTR